MSTLVRVALATCAAHPEIDDDTPPLVAALRDLDVQAEPVVWDDDAVDWSAYAAVVLRGTWDYPARRTQFLTWCRRVEDLTLLANPADVVAWSTDKTYLRELADAGVPVVPSTFLEPGQDVVLPDAGEFVVKPSVSAGSRDTARWTAGRDDEAARGHARGLLEAGRTVLVQPYVASVDTRGETALLHFGGQLSHAAAKAALLSPRAGMVEGTYAEETMSAREPSAAEQALAAVVLDAMPFEASTLTYARVDLVEAVDGSPLLLELELAEPSMFLGFHPDAARRFAASIAGLVSPVA